MKRVHFGIFFALVIMMGMFNFAYTSICTSSASMYSSVVCSVSNETNTPNKVINWGLTHRGNNSTPDIPSGAGELLNQTNGIYLGDTSEKKIYLTFDLGYEAGYTNDVLDELAKHSIKAIFFVCGNYIKETPIVSRILNEGHTIGNHTDKHLDLSKKDEQTIKKDISDFDTKFSEAYPSYNFKSKYFRPPFGRISTTSMKVSGEYGLKTVLWSNAIADWDKKPIDPIKCSDKLTQRLHNGSIILLHITNSGTPKMLSQFIPKAIEAGYEFGDATQL